MSESAVETLRPGAAAADRRPGSQARPRSAGGFVRAHPGWMVAIALVAVAAIVVVLTPTRPSYDAYGWLVWGYQTIHLSLDLGGAPSWKPLPYLFTVPFALFGSAQLWLWMITSVAISLAGAVFAGRIAYRLVLEPSRGRAPALVAALFAGAAVLAIEDYTHYILSVQSDPMIVTCCLGAIDCHLSRRYRWALVLGTLAALGRPEAWPFLGLYMIWAWRRAPAMRWLVAAAIAVIAFMWFGIPTITNHRPFVAGQLALNSPRELHQGKVTGTIKRYTELEYLPIWIAALIAVAIAFLRRNRLVLILAAGCVGWVVVEIAFAFHGWPALPRYMFEAAGAAAVLAGVGIGWALSEAPRLRPGLPRWAGIPLVVVLVAALIPGALSRMRTERSDLRREHARTDQIALLGTAINAVGGYQQIRYCGEPVVRTEFASVLAYDIKLDVGFVGNLPHNEMRHSYPIVLFTPLRQGGWSVLPWHTQAAKRASCRGLRAEYAITPRHPTGVLLRGVRPRVVG